MTCKTPGDFRARLFGEVTDRGSVVHDEPKMAVAIRLLMPAAAERNKLIAHIDKRHGHTASLVLVAAPKIERKMLP